MNIQLGSNAGPNPMCAYVYGDLNNRGMIFNPESHLIYSRVSVYKCALAERIYTFMECAGAQDQAEEEEKDEAGVLESAASQSTCVHVIHPFRWALRGWLLILRRRQILCFVPAAWHGCKLFDVIFNEWTNELADQIRPHALSYSSCSVAAAATEEMWPICYGNNGTVIRHKRKMNTSCRIITEHNNRAMVWTLEEKEAHNSNSFGKHSSESFHPNVYIHIFNLIKVIGMRLIYYITLLI